MIKNQINEKNKFYFGNFQDGKYNGNGILYYNEEKTNFYIGEFKNNLRNGKGKYYENKKLIYEGEFKDDLYDGKGKIYYKDGTVYEGEFIKNKASGKGNKIEKTEKNKPSPGQKILGVKTTQKLNNALNNLLGKLQNLNNKFGCFFNEQCRYCNHSINDHNEAGASIWECKICGAKCENDIIGSFI